MHLRSATREDVPAILDIYNHEVCHGTATFDTVPVEGDAAQRWFDPHEDARHPVVVAAGDDGQVLGWASLSAWSARCAYARAAEVSVYVHQDARRRGVGRALLRSLVARGRAAGLGVLLARITSESAASLALHRREGFRLIGTMHRVGEKHGRVLDVVLMELPLDDAGVAGAGTGVAGPARPRPEALPAAVPAVLADWYRRGVRIDALGHAVFTLVTGSGDGAPVLVLHGFPTCCYDFHHVLPRLAAGRRVVLHDHLGFGLSAKPADWSYSLIEQTDVALAVWRHHGVTAGHVVAHDYGASIATELLARRAREGLPVQVLSVTLSNASVDLRLAKLRRTQQLLRDKRAGPLLARAAGAGFFKRQIRALCALPVADADLDALWAALEFDGGRRRLPAIAGYIDERDRFRERWLGALRDLDVPCHIVWGCKDPIARPAIAERIAELARGARLTWLDHVGHYPMLEDPEAWADAVTAGLRP